MINVGGGFAAGHNPGALVAFDYVIFDLPFRVDKNYAIVVILDDIVFNDKLALSINHKDALLQRVLNVIVLDFA